MRRLEKQGNTEAMKRLSNRSKVILILAGAVLMLVGGVTARYIWQSWSDYATVTSDPFYFTASLLGDSVMTSNADDGSYSFGDRESGTWHLYGGGEHKVDFSIHNYYDELRVTQADIKYSVTLKDDNNTGAKLTYSDGTALPESLPVLGNAAAGKTYSQAEQQFCLTIPAGYTKASTVTVLIQSTEPYKKTLELIFVVHPAGEGLTYEVVDSVNSPYAELIIRNGTIDKVQPTIDWSATTLSINNTNELTFTYANGTFTPQSGMETKKMQVSRELNAGESVSIYFFKSDSKSYACPVTVVEPESASTYTITIKNPA